MKQQASLKAQGTYKSTLHNISVNTVREEKEDELHPWDDERKQKNSLPPIGNATVDSARQP